MVSSKIALHSNVRRHDLSCETLRAESDLMPMTRKMLKIRSVRATTSKTTPCGWTLNWSLKSISRYKLRV
jgi:hypothetical protein